MEPRPSPIPDAQPPKLKFYFLPNLLTAANLFCGFVALTKIVNVSKDDLIDGNFTEIYRALFFILLAFIINVFYNRMVRHRN